LREASDTCRDAIDRVRPHGSLDTRGPDAINRVPTGLAYSLLLPFDASGVVLFTCLCIVVRRTGVDDEDCFAGVGGLVGARLVVLALDVGAFTPGVAGVGVLESKGPLLSWSVAVTATVALTGATGDISPVSCMEEPDVVSLSG